MDIFKKMEEIAKQAREIEKQMQKVEVVLSYKDGRMSIKFQNASLSTYGFIMCEFLSHIAEEHPDMIPSLKSACNTFMESTEVTDYDE